MRITNEQDVILDALIWERLRDNPNSSALIQNFENKNNDVLMFFSLNV